MVLSYQGYKLARFTRDSLRNGLQNVQSLLAVLFEHKEKRQNRADDIHLFTFLPRHNKYLKGQKREKNEENKKKTRGNFWSKINIYACGKSSIFIFS